MTKINKLARDILGDNINYIPGDQRLERVTGKTTGIILKQISDAILNPEAIIKIGEFRDRRDHISGGFLDQLIKMIDKLELKYMYVNRIRAELVYSPFEEVEDACSNKSVDETLDQLLLAINMAVIEKDYGAASSYSQAYQRIKATK